MIDLLLKDNENMKMQEMRFLTETVEGMLYNNLFELNNNGYNLSVESLTSETTEFWEQRGYVIEDSLFEKIVGQYNQSSSNPIKEWIKL